MAASEEKNKGIQKAILSVAIIICIGYAFIWVMLPTKLYRQSWQPKIRAQTNSTYFGTQGATMLLYTFPVLLVAALGCLYLHVGRNSSHSSTNKADEKIQGLSEWKRPVIIKVLGIVSWIELAFLVMFIALLVWSFSNYLSISFASITPKSAARTGEKVWQAKLEAAGLRLGLVGNICLSLLFFPVTRGSSVLPLFGLTSEASVKYHIWLGHITMALFTAHGLCYVIFWATTHHISKMLEWVNTDISNLAGEISLAAGLGMWATTFPSIRRKMFELFFYTHYLYILFVIFFVFHVGISYSCIMLPGFYLFLVDRYLRFLQSRKHVRLVSARLLPCETIELNFSKSQGLRYTPTSILFVNVPGISKLQWHPFTITSSSSLEADQVSVMIKGDGSWSKKLYQILSSPNSPDRLDVSVEGPYGPASTHFLRHDLLVMVSGGSGVTPFFSIIRELMHKSQSSESKIPQVLLISVFKNSSDLTMLDLILPISGAQSELSKLRIQIEAYITREKQPPALENNKNNVQIKWFKSNHTDQPMTPILGHNNWLWLGAIISSSFILFLILLGLIIRYHIYPINQRTDNDYPYWKKAVFFMLFICISIVIAATAGFLWNKRNINAKEAKQIQNVSGASPNFQWSYNAEREMESLPQQWLAQHTNVHFGQRPDLKRMLLEHKEESVGVLVCGPKKLRHDVAKICTSASSANLHFESISFSW
ncbi:PREDICTED: ferric reduction oxidase 2 [Ipomoea nil]|uniref:ferric reduction oxidase 2 n=1 Tax=Ipomoea nil TaxID=35883 RepID=UPI000900CD17|nr:PREDICTED: ferric reduction oxidase 2 [Ipomoea nil]